jgi:hypothetical protein
LNARLTKVLTPESTFVDRKWKDIRVNIQIVFLFLLLLALSIGLSIGGSIRS